MTRNVARALLIAAALMVGGCSSSPPEAPTPSTAPTEGQAIKDRADTKIPCDDPIITIASWFCPTPTESDS
jgi:hypothetical protein